MRKPTSSGRLMESLGSLNQSKHQVLVKNGDTLGRSMLDGMGHRRFLAQTNP
ncbi:hypothetical protein [Pseudobacteriovorax antillogorgiicola]|uniref:Uncharacterized protein n=1 Tax=Pseudobacteriovorax antillogorgiicola TaxID=1513793 RepID=A0A1Y6CER4_9BACT|nr:hypothetical protein [Pseudobacteriovorax antillogorgiicola]TCS47656.1 hypothetical protein EDD56_12097 [Pseudobacteriovorax antillogorgiicola]SMF59802.1 hypothetical protein SAMN06296036_12043 [Pseudobacteriovorax antillogorgiicola]